jgi:hypothetical protein
MRLPPPWRGRESPARRIASGIIAPTSIMSARVLRGRFLFAAWLTLALTAGVDAVRTPSSDVSIFASVIDASGQPITDLVATDFAIREDGLDREVVSAKRATQPLSVALLADTTTAAEGYVPDLRAGFKAFIETVLQAEPESQLSLWEFGQAAVRIQDFTSDREVLLVPASRLFPKPRSASVLLEALYDSSKSLAGRPSHRRDIVAIKVEPAVEQSRREPPQVNESLIFTRAQLWIISVQKGQLANESRDLALNTLVRNAGGRREFIVAASAIEGYMRQYAAALTSQYEVTYRRPSGPAKIVQTGVRREGARVIAGIAAPQ